MSQPSGTRDSDVAELIADRYRLERLLARGGMGEVFAACDQSTGRRVALKRMLVNQVGQRAPTVNFMREYHALSGLRHPRIIDVYDYGVDRNVPFYTMELLDGQDLRELSPVPYRDACRYLRDVASSLALLHARRLLHRDLSPRNVRRTSDGRCKLLDFGAMVPFGVPPNLTGTPPFIAPEALEGGPLDQRADLYSLGALAYFVLTGRYAHAVSETAALRRAWAEPIVRPMQLVHDLPEALEELVLALLSMNAMQRPGSAAEVIDRLAAAAQLETQDDDIATARSFLVGSQLFGRSGQMARLSKHMSNAVSGHGSAILVCGESGTGRSRVLADAAVIGQTMGLTVLRVVARPRASIGALATELIQGLFQATPFEAQRASNTRPLATAHSFAADSGDDRTLVLREMSELVQEVARARPLLITVDDLERADEFSSALVAALAYRSGASQLTVIASYNDRHETPVLAQVPNLAESIKLTPLDRAQTIMLVASLFGDVPNVERVSDWLYRVAAGNPKLTFELADHLLAQGVVRYIDGTWLLPSEVTQDLPPSAAKALLLRLDRVSIEARGLAELLCVSRSGASAERILDLAQRPPDAVFNALGELVSCQILESAGTEYAFAQDALRENLLEALDPERRQQLHSAWAERLLSTNPSPEDRLEAGWHLVHTHDELRGADLLAEIAPNLVERRVSMAVAVPALERALEIYTRHDRPLAQQLHLRSLLVMSSFLVDHRLADRHADATLNALYPFTGLPLFERLSRILGATLAFLLSLAWTFVRWKLQPHVKRGPHVLDALRYYASACTGLIGVRTLAIDVEGIRAVVERMRLFERAPHVSLRLIYSLAKAILLVNQGRGADTAELVSDLLAHLDSQNRKPLRMSETERRDLLIGVLMLEGLNECYRERSKALSFAHRLEQIGTPLAAAGAMRISMTYHMLRGETDETQRYRRLLDLSAIQNGTVWQIDWLAVPIEGLAALTWSDLVVMRRSLDALERMTAAEPSFANMRDTLRVSYHYRRGDYAAAVRLGEEYMQAHPPFTLLGWAPVYAQTALSYLQLGQAHRALEILQSALELVTDRHRQYVIHFSMLEAAFATALAVAGERERGESMLRTLIERSHASGEHSRAVVIHEYRVELARLLGDRAAVSAALKDMRDAAVASGSSRAILLADSVASRRARSSDSTRSTFKAESLGVVPSEEMSPSSISDSLPQRGAAQALQLLGAYAGGGEAYLFLVQDGTLYLTASLDQRAPPTSLARLLSTVPANDQHGSRMVKMTDDVERIYTVVCFSDDVDKRVWLAALREGSSRDHEIPRSLLTEVGRALSARSR